MAQRERRRRGGDLGAAPRARPAPAQPPAPVLHEAGPRRVQARRPRRVPGGVLDAVLSARAAPRRAGRARGSRRGGAGRLRDRVPARVRPRPRARAARRRARPRDGRRPHRPRRRCDRSCAHRRHAHPRRRRRPRAVGLSRRRYPRRYALGRAPLPPPMSYTLRGRIESRLAAAAVPLAVAVAWSAAARVWWPLDLAALVLAVGLALDVGAYHRLLTYQPGWAALPLGALELGLVMLLARALEIPAPAGPAAGFFFLAWLWAQVLAHAGLPLARLEYAEDGGELGRAGVPLGVAVAVVLVTVGGIAWLTQPPTVRLHGVVEGPLVLDHAQTLVGGVVRGGIVITADDVTVRDVTVVGGDNPIEVREAHDVRLDRVHV